MPQGTISRDGWSGQGVTLSPLGHPSPAVQSLSFGTERVASRRQPGTRDSDSPPPPLHPRQERQRETPCGVGLLASHFTLAQWGPVLKFQSQQMYF